MLSNLKGYQPEVIQFVLEESVKEKFPTELLFFFVPNQQFCNQSTASYSVFLSPL